MDWQYKYPEKLHNNFPYQKLSRLVYSILILCPLQSVQGWGLLINIAQHFSFLSAVILKKRKIQHGFLLNIYKKFPIKNYFCKADLNPDRYLSRPVLSSLSYRGIFESIRQNMVKPYYINIGVGRYEQACLLNTNPCIT